MSFKSPVKYTPEKSRGRLRFFFQTHTGHITPRDKSVFLIDSTDQPLGIKLQSIQEVINQDKHCLLQLGLNHVENLLKQSIYPIIIYIKPKNKKGRKFRKLLSGHREEDLMEACQMEELQLETLPVMFSTVEPNAWSSTDELLAVIRSTILSQQSTMVWLEQERLQ
ncbi:caspase recruitment domain-containing protein 11-like isoform X1 [Onychostoma macrolepis]|uniref:caspase recruitment domain-containing protein 11-like isoform X1 n=1 Tax=Onychostoma macrolepis TaxID=369639 RepID=UPI00272B2E31|nr:caspase recruitment domain-containing protein 11-like isoform X1 [Onychostoma macrolepis]